MRPFTVLVPLSVVGQLAVLLELFAPKPVPQSNAYVNPGVVSACDGSDGFVSERKIVSPSLTEVGALNVAVGGTFVTLTVKLAEPAPPSLSVTNTVTV